MLQGFDIFRINPVFKAATKLDTQGKIAVSAVIKDNLPELSAFLTAAG